MKFLIILILISLLVISGCSSFADCKLDCKNIKIIEICPEGKGMYGIGGNYVCTNGNITNKITNDINKECFEICG